MRKPSIQINSNTKVRRNHENSQHVIWIISIATFTCIIAIIGAVLGSVGVIKQVHNRVDKSLSNEWETKCFVFQRVSIPYPCNPCNNSNCITYFCSEEKFKVRYEIFDGTEIFSYININGNSKKQNIQIGQEYPCYYDRSTDYNSVKWEHKQWKSQTVMISIGISLIIIAFIVLTLLGIYMIVIERPRLNQLKRRNQMLTHLSAEH
ncbi:unnamed protein product [Adineta steineri]|uniref:Uncharacterized protein n=1 Tax=Adineta steineri TaxID=433720 RepID=A0A815HR78_9BILA|nr:unnamed protein product [Adineta steineri]CAF1355921.1 unnamed protein product [Adineta steineri]